MDWLTTLGPTLLVLLGTGLGWLIKTQREELRAVEQRITEERRQIYRQILEPYAHILAGVKGDDALVKQAQKQIQSAQYRMSGIDLTMMGSDKALRAYTNLLALFYSMEGEGTKPEAREVIDALGSFLLAIRRDQGYKKTKISSEEILAFMFKELAIKYRRPH